MLSKLYSPAKRDDGFTLLELLIVVVVIGVLAAIALPVFLNQQRAAVDAAVQSDVHNTALQVQQWRTDHPAASAADAAAYYNAGGTLTQTDNNGYLGVVVRADGTYAVCGYNANGLRFTAPGTSFVFEAGTGKFGAGEGCLDALAPDQDATGTSTGGSGSGSTGSGSGSTGAGSGSTGSGGAGSGSTGSGGTGSGSTSGDTTASGAPVPAKHHRDPNPGAHGTTAPVITDSQPSGTGSNPSPSSSPDPTSSTPGGGSGTGSTGTVSNGTTTLSTTGAGSDFVYYSDADHSLGGVATFNAGHEYNFTNANWYTLDGGQPGVDTSETYDGTNSWHNNFTPSYTQASFGFTFGEATAGDLYTVSFTYKITGKTDTSNTPRLVYYDPTGSHVAGVVDLVADGQWHQAKIVVTASSTSGAVSFSGQTTGDGTGTGGTYIDNINIYKAS